jgi:hypothetical protein
MSTLAAMISIGCRDRLTDISFPRLSRWASKNNYSCILIKEALQADGALPYFAKLAVSERFPGYDRYCIVDDDLLLASHAPPLPDIPKGYVGLARDEEQGNTTNPIVKWTANTGFIVHGAEARHLLQKACSEGEDPTIWGIADQGALNSVLWSENRIFELDPRWNFAPVLAFFIRGRGWETWTKSKIYRLSFYGNIAFNLFSSERQLIKQCWGCHMIRASYPRFFDRVVP